jgi:hypothetical protein
MEILYAVLASLLAQLPVFLIWLGGAILCLVFWKRCPRAALFTLIALILFFGISLFDNYLSIVVPIYARERGWSASQTGVYFAVKGVLASLARAVAWVLVLLAIFGWRNKEAK